MPAKKIRAARPPAARPPREPATPPAAPREAPAGLRALCVGINYAGTGHQLNGCLNDADDWGALLRGLGFAVQGLAEEAATLENLVLAVSGLVSSLRAGETGVITYSGHGTWVPDADEPDGHDDALVPYDVGEDGHNLLLGDDLGLMFDKLAQGARLIFVTDCCHSGTVYRFMPSPWEKSAAPRLVRFLPPAHFLKSDHLVRRMERSFGQRSNASSASKKPSRGLVHFSGCMDSEYSNDAVIGGRACGAFSYFALQSFRQGGSYREVWDRVRRNLPSFEYQQTPLLNSLPGLKDLPLFR